MIFKTTSQNEFLLIAFKLPIFLAYNSIVIFRGRRKYPRVHER